MFSLSLSQLFSRTRLLFAALTLGLLVACSPLDVAGKVLGGGGPNVAANTQVGATNNQGVTTNKEGPKVEFKKDASLETLNQNTTNNINLPPWAVLVMVCLAAGGAIGWVDNITRLFIRRK